MQFERPRWNIPLTWGTGTHRINTVIHTPVPFNITDHGWVQVKLRRSPIALGCTAVGRVGWWVLFWFRPQVASKGVRAAEWNSTVQKSDGTGSNRCRCGTTAGKMHYFRVLFATLTETFFENACMSTPEMHMIQLDLWGYCKTGREPGRNSGEKITRLLVPKNIF